MSPAGQARPQPPQWLLSTWGLTQVAPHIIRGAEQVPSSQKPETQRMVPGQVLPQRPQLKRSTKRLVQKASQRLVPLGQAATHSRSMHSCPAGQALPQRPQCLASVKVLVHTPSQRTWGAGQGSVMHEAPTQS